VKLGFAVQSDEAGAGVVVVVLSLLLQAAGKSGVMK
jgi:hypothetical protein